MADEKKDHSSETLDPRWAAEDFESELLKFYRKEPEYLDEQAFKEHLHKTTVYRYGRADELLREVEAELRNLKDSGTVSAADADIMISKIDRAVVAFGYGALRYNGTLASGASKRPELHYKKTGG